MTAFKSITLLLSFALFISCQDKPKNQQSEIVIHSRNKWSQSTPSGLLIANAIKETHQLDIVFYPTAFLNKNKVGLLKLNMSDEEINLLSSIYPLKNSDQFIIGSLSGKDIKRFMFLQAESSYRNELQVAGLMYDYKFTGGLKKVSNLRIKNKYELNDDTIYKVAISQTFYFNGQTAPGYLFGYGFNFKFKRYSGPVISAKDSLISYLKNMQELPLLLGPQSLVSTFKKSYLGKKEIHQIQSDRHVSPYRGHQVTTQGVVTAVGFSDRYPTGHEIYIQSLNPDNNDKTSEGLYLFAPEMTEELVVGDVIEVSGTVYEDRFNSGDLIANGMTRTGLKEITQINKLKSASTSCQMPAPVLIGAGGRVPPTDKISTFDGNLNRKDHLNLNDGIDFWESLESMRIMVNQPRVVGFSGGKSKFEDKSAGKSYLNIFVTPGGGSNDKSDTPTGGVVIKEAQQDFNPHIITLESHHLTTQLKLDSVYNVGDIMSSSINGLFVYEKSFFNSGHYALLLTEPPSIKSNCFNTNLKIEFNTSSIIKIEDRPRTQVEKKTNKLTVATYNIENLAQVDKDRLQVVADSIQTSLNCPDIVNFVEIQDDNGISLNNGSDASGTLNDIINNIPCPDDVNYKYININPFTNGEGGQPGGNIRMSMLYNSNRVSFKAKVNNDPFAETFITSDGQLSHNPGRVYPNDSAFKSSRKSLVAEFNFMGERVVVIGNHFNSKLGDASLWGAIQPPLFKSGNRRTKMANKVNQFVQNLIATDPNVNIIVAGDFNAHLTEKAMIALEGNQLKNLVTYNNLIPENKRYTTNHNGNSQGLDYILVNKNLLKKGPEVEILHINSDYMQKHSDHDPVLAAFTF